MPARIVTIQVSRVYKDSSVTSEVQVHTPMSATACGYDFVPSKKYLVYADAHGGTLWTSKCTATKLVIDAAEDRTLLGPGWKP